MTAPPKVFPDRWRLSRAGIVNVWHYLDNEFDLSGGRMILRGTNGSGKSRALELLLPFLLDADRRKMDATGSGRVNLHELMRAGAGEQTNRLGYLWLELENDEGYLTLGALIRSNRSTDATSVWYFMSPLRVGHDLQLISGTREPLSRQGLSDRIGTAAITDSAEAQRERVRATVFGLQADNTHDRDRFTGLLQLLHTLRSPDVGNRIDEGRLPQILSDSLPPLDEQTLQRAGEQLDGLTTLRQAQQRLAESHDHVQTFLGVYRRYAAATLASTAADTLGAVEAVDAATSAATTWALEFERLCSEEASARAEVEAAGAAVEELRHAIAGLRARDIFKQADELAQRDHLVDARAAAADAALAEAGRERTNHDRAVATADERLGELRQEADRSAAALARARDALLAAHLTGTALVDEVRLVDRPAAAGGVIARLVRDGEPTSVPRPEPAGVTLVPADTAAAESAAAAAAEAAERRGDLAQRRLAEARRLDAADREVARLEADAERESAQAELDQQDTDATARERDDAAVTLATDWRAWIADPATAELFGEIDWSSLGPLAPLLVDVEALCGDAADSPGDQYPLDELDALAAGQAGPAQQSLANRRAELDQDQRTDDAGQADLLAEQARLEHEEDPAPDGPPWLAVDRPGVPLWRAVDFAEHVTEAGRAGLEAALLASGLLTASIEGDGSLRADDGTVLLSPASTAAGRPLSVALQPDPASPLAPGLVRSVLDGIGLDDDSATSIRTDGSWRNGALRGRHTVAVARHVGAAARARARQERLDAIAAELAELAARAERRRVERIALDERKAAIDSRVAKAPRSTALRTKRDLASAAAARAANSRGRAATATERARTARTAWSAELRTHRDTCALHALPTEQDALDKATADAREAGRACHDFVGALRALRASNDRHRHSLSEAAQRASERDAAQERAEGAWREWRDIAAEVAAIHEAIDLSVEQARAELKGSQTALRQANSAAAAAAESLETLVGRRARAENEVRHADQAAAASREEMVTAARRFTHRVALAGLVRAATDAELRGIDRPEVEQSVRAAAVAAVNAVGRPAQAPNQDAVLRAFQAFDRNVAGQLDVTSTVDDGVTLITVVGAGDDRTLAGAASSLTARLEAGRAALSEREREVFTTFVLGGVAEELRRRINQAGDLVEAMNASLRTISTSNGIGVRLSWRLADDSPDLHRIAELVRTADAVRSSAQNGELTELLRRRVDEFYAADPSSGYAVHLSQALDYRRWHRVEVTILGPNPGQERRISSRTKLSQGETRFVSYVTLFAAADGYLSGLSRTDRQLRVILLDDAFAKVDEPTIAELMGLLVRLDLDFVMTGHALWGCYPQVPRLDVYEVRRQEGTSAVTTHVHWDGHTRHLRSTA